MSVTSEETSEYLTSEEALLLELHRLNSTNFLSPLRLRLKTKKQPFGPIAQVIFKFEPPRDETERSALIEKFGQAVYNFNWVPREESGDLSGGEFDYTEPSIARVEFNGVRHPVNNSQVFFATPIIREQVGASRVASFASSTTGHSQSVSFQERRRDRIAGYKRNYSVWPQDSAQLLVPHKPEGGTELESESTVESAAKKQKAVDSDDTSSLFPSRESVEEEASDIPEYIAGPEYDGEQV
jgi:hypothetical protein